MMELVKNTAVVFTEDPHSYHRTSDGKELIGVTTMMRKHGLSANYDAISPDILAKAAARGKEIHRQLEDYDDGLPARMDDNLRAYKALNLEVVESEYLVSDNETVASCIDKVLGDCSLADVKTTSTVHTSAVSWQLSIYAYLFEQQNPTLKVPHLYCIHVRDGKAKLIEVERKKDETIKELIRCEKEGEIFLDDAPEEVENCFTDAQVMRLEEVLDLLATINAQKKLIEAEYEGYMAQMEEYMTERHIDEIGCSLGKFVKGKDYERTTLDSTAIKKNYPAIAEKYSKTTLVKGKVSFKPNK